MKFKKNDIVQINLPNKPKFWIITNISKKDISLRSIDKHISVLWPKEYFEHVLVTVNPEIPNMKEEIYDKQTLKIIEDLEQSEFGDWILLNNSYFRGYDVFFEQWFFSCIKNERLYLHNRHGKKISIPFSDLKKAYQKNDRLSRARKKKRAKEKKEILLKEKPEIEADHDLQIQKFGRVLKTGDLVQLDSAHKCSQCQNSIYRIVAIPASIKKPISIKCYSCSNNLKIPYTKEEIVSITRCPNCGNVNINTEYEPYLQGYVISCDNCKSTKSSKINRSELYESIINANNEQILESVNASYQSLKIDDNRLLKNDGIYTHVTDVINDSNLLFNMQLIDSPNNHVTRGHNITNKIVRIAYKVNENEYRTFSYKCHFCTRCNTYFDFYTSFLEQIKNNGIKKEDLVISLVKVYNSLGYEMTTTSNFSVNKFEIFNSESFLHSLGYVVGEYGLSEKRRHQLLKAIFSKKIMSIAEMKATINSNINLFKNRKGYELAVKEWKEDINFLNTLL